jgi:hypothetical protein
MANPEKVVSRIDSALSSAVPLPIESGPVALDLDAAAVAWLIPWACHPEARIGFRHGVDGAKQTALYAAPGDLRQPERVLREIRRALDKVPAGNALEILACAPSDAYSDDDDEAESAPEGANTDKTRMAAAARFRLKGMVGPGAKWSVTHAFPKADGRSVQAAAEILGHLLSNSDAWTNDSAEARAIVELAQKSSHFILSNPAQRLENKIETEGANIRTKAHRRPYVALMLLRHRLPDAPWDLRPSWEQDERFRTILTDQAEQVARALAEANARNEVPRGSLLLETPAARYFETEFSKLAQSAAYASFLCDRYPDISGNAKLSLMDVVHRIDADMKAAGLSHLGDFHNDQLSDKAFRAYGAAEGVVGLLSTTPGNPLLHWSFLTRLGQDFWVSTATFPLGPKAAKPARASHRANVRGSVAALRALHQEHVAAHQSEGPPGPGPTDLIALLKWIEQFNQAVAAG